MPALQAKYTAGVPVNCTPHAARKENAAFRLIPASLVVALKNATGG
jgi:hypothetical protein